MVVKGSMYKSAIFTRTAVKKAIKTILKQNPKIIPTPRINNETDIPCNHTAKDFYNMGTEKDHIPTSETYWKFFFSNINNNLNFEDAYKQKTS